MAKKETTTTDVGQTQDTQPVKVDTRGRQRHVYGDVEKAWGSPVAEWTVEERLRIPSREIMGVDSATVINAIFSVLSRNDIAAFNVTAMIVEGHLASLKRKLAQQATQTQQS